MDDYNYREKRDECKCLFTIDHFIRFLSEFVCLIIYLLIEIMFPVAFDRNSKVITWQTVQNRYDFNFRVTTRNETNTFDSKSTATHNEIRKVPRPYFTY